MADETWTGGKPSNMSNAKRPKQHRWDYGRTDEPAVLALVDTGTGEVRSRVIPNVRGNTLRAAIAEHVSTAHLPRYLAEYDFRYSTRKITDTERMVHAGQAVRRASPDLQAANAAALAL